MPFGDADRIHFQTIVHGIYAAAGLQTKPTANILHYRRTTFGTNYDAAELVTALHTKFKAAWKAAASASWTWDETWVRCMDGDAEAYHQVTVAEVGGVAGEPYPPFASMLISKATSLRGKSYRGRLFVAGVPESGCASSLLTAGQKTLLDALATALTGTVTTAAGLQYVPFLFAASLTDMQTEFPVVKGTDIISFTAHSQLTSTTSRRLRST